MICICTALHCEAQPLIRALHMTKDTGFCSQALFMGADAALIVSGTGKTRAAVAAARAFNLFTAENSLTVLNCGVCGGAGGQPKGQAYLINKITDSGSGKCFYPDLLFAHQLPEETLTTFERPVAAAQPTAPTSGLVDMEGSGFFEAASLFLPPSRIVLLKVVFDHLEDKAFKAEEVGRAIDNNVEVIVEIINKLSAGESAGAHEEVSPLELLLQDAAQRLRLSQSRRIELKKAARSCLVRNGGRLEELKAILCAHAAHVSSPKTAFASILRDLAAH